MTQLMLTTATITSNDQIYHQPSLSSPSLPNDHQTLSNQLSTINVPVHRIKLTKAQPESTADSSGFAPSSAPQMIATVPMSGSKTTDDSADRTNNGTKTVLSVHSLSPRSVDNDNDRDERDDIDDDCDSDGDQNIDTDADADTDADSRGERTDHAIMSPSHMPPPAGPPPHQALQSVYPSAAPLASRATSPPRAAVYFGRPTHQLMHSSLTSPSPYITNHPDGHHQAVGPLNVTTTFSHSVITNTSTNQSAILVNGSAKTTATTATTTTTTSPPSKNSFCIDALLSRGTSEPAHQPPHHHHHPYHQPQHAQHLSPTTVGRSAQHPALDLQQNHHHHAGYPQPHLHHQYHLPAAGSPEYSTSPQHQQQRHSHSSESHRFLLSAAAAAAAASAASANGDDDVQMQQQRYADEREFTPSPDGDGSR